MNARAADFFETYWFPAILIGAVVALIVVAAYLMNEDSKTWAAFAAAHNCKVVGRMSGDVQTAVGYGMTANGQSGTIIATTVAPEKTGYRCDDGVTYWR